MSNYNTTIFTAHFEPTITLRSYPHDLRRKFQNKYLRTLKISPVGKKRANWHMRFWKLLLRTVKRHTKPGKEAKESKG